MLKRLSDAGFQAKYEGSGFFTTREVSMKFDENLSIRLFQLLVNTGKDGKFCIQCEAENETSYSSVDEVIKAAKQRKEKIDTLTKDIDLAEKITTNPEKHRMYGKLFEQLNEVRDSFSSGSTDKMLFAQFANQAAWAVVENHMKGNPQGLKLEDAAKYIQHLYDSLSNSRNPAPNQVDTVAQYYKLQFENNGETKAKALAIDLLQKTIGKSREVGNWNQLEPDDRKQVEENEKLLKKLKE